MSKHPSCFPPPKTSKMLLIQFLSTRPLSHFHQCKHGLCQLPTPMRTHSHHSPRCVFRTLLITGRREWVGGSRVILPAAPDGDKISFVLLVEGSIPDVCWSAGLSPCYIFPIGGIFFNMNKWDRIRSNDMWCVTHDLNVSRSHQKDLQLTWSEMNFNSSLLLGRIGNVGFIWWLINRLHVFVKGESVGRSSKLSAKHMLEMTKVNVNLTTRH